MITMTVVAQVKPEKRNEFMHALTSLYVRKEEKGLKKSTLYQEMKDPNGFRLITEWETQKDLETYLRAERFRVLLGALEVLCKESEIRYSEKTENLPATPKAQLLFPESSWRRNLAMAQEDGGEILKGKKGK